MRHHVRPAPFQSTHMHNLTGKDNLATDFNDITVDNQLVNLDRNHINTAVSSWTCRWIATWWYLRAKRLIQMWWDQQNSIRLPAWPYRALTTSIPDVFYIWQLLLSIFTPVLGKGYQNYEPCSKTTERCTTFPRAFHGFILQHGTVFHVCVLYKVRRHPILRNVNNIRTFGIHPCATLEIWRRFTRTQSV